MKSTSRWLLGLALCALAQSAAMAADKNDEISAETLAAMQRSSTIGHPDEQGEYAGMAKYARGDYVGAMKDFMYGARYGDKLSQLSIGLMYLNGEGVQKDPVTAFAWVAIAAERKYPQFLATRDQIWTNLDAGQREQAKALVEQLYAQYGDVYAKPRMERALRYGLQDLTGRNMGYQAASIVRTTAPETYRLPCAAPTIDNAPVEGCGQEHFAKARWSPNDYFKARDGVWTGTVTVGGMETDTTPAR